MTELKERLQAALGDRYRLERELGAGAMGVVFLAEDLKLGRMVAVKVLRPEIGQSVGGDRFLREVRISARLSHPHILSLIDSGAADDLLYYVMYYVDGQTLRERLEGESRLEVDEAVRITREVAEALEHAHGQGIVHRDVKPSNILLDQGHPLVCDFGIARAVDDIAGETLTRTGLAVGTPVYMSPEQATDGGEVDQRADVYALGCVLYEMLIGEPPFSGGPPQVLVARKAAQTVPGMRAARDAVPVHVERAVMKALSPDPDDRFESVAAFAAALEDPKLAARATRRGRWTATGRRLGRWAVALVVLLGLAGAAMVLADSGADEPLRIRSNQVTALPGLEDSPSISPDGQWVVYAGDNGDERDIYRRSLVGERAINLTEDSPDDDIAPAFSPDGTRIAFRSERDGGGLYVMGPMGEAVRRVSDVGHTPAWSPDGTALVYALESVGLQPLNVEPENPGLGTVDLETGEHRELLDTDAVLPSWSPNGRWITYTARGDETRASLWIVPADGGDPARLTDRGGNDWGGSWSPDGRFLYFTSDRGGSMNLWRVRMDASAGRTAGEPEPLPTPSPFAAHPSVSADGDRVLFASVQTTQNVERATLDPTANTLRDPFPLTTGTRKWSSPDPSPDGSRVVFYTRDQPEGDLYVVRRDGTGLRQLTGDSAIDRVPRWSPDGSRIAYFSNRAGVIHAWAIEPDGSGNEQLVFGEDPTAPGAWSPDGRQLAINAPYSHGYILDLGQGPGDRSREPIVFDSAWGRFVANDWSPDGTRLAGMHGWSDNGVGYYDLATDEHVPVTDFGQWPVWMPDSRRMLFVSGGKGFYMADAGTGAVHRVHSTVRDVLGPPRVTADGRELVYSRRVTEGDLWAVHIEPGGE